MRAMTFIFFDGHFGLVPPKIKILFITYSFSACTFIFYIVNMILILNHLFFFFLIFAIILFTFPIFFWFFRLFFSLFRLLDYISACQNLFVSKRVFYDIIQLLLLLFLVQHAQLFFTASISYLFYSFFSYFIFFTSSSIYKFWSNNLNEVNINSN